MTEPNTLNSYYPYARVSLNNPTLLLVYTGTPITAEVAPASASTWKPPVVPPGLAVYYDGVGWVVGTDLTRASISTLQALATNMAVKTFTTTVQGLTSGYPVHEQSSWAQQVAEAQSLASGGDTPLLTVLANAKGVSVQTLAQSVIDKDGVYKAGYAAALASLQTSRSTIAAAKSVSDLPAFTLDSVKTNR